jgi:hypothetical protein
MKPVLNGPTYGVNPETLQFPYLEKTIKKIYAEILRRRAIRNTKNE